MEQTRYIILADTKCREYSSEYVISYYVICTNRSVYKVNSTLESFNMPYHIETALIHVYSMQAA